MNIDWKARIESKTFWISTISLVVLLAQQLGFDATTIIPKNYVDIINTLFALLAVLGIVVDNSTKGLSDSTDTTNTK
jgi:phi LC3 family holin